MENDNLTAVDWDRHGMQLLRDSKYGEAIEAFTQAIHVSKTYASAYTHRAEAYRADGQPELADADLKTHQEMIGSRRSAPSTEGSFENYENILSEDTGKKKMLVGALSMAGGSLLFVLIFGFVNYELPSSLGESVDFIFYFPPVGGLILGGAISFLWGLMGWLKW